MLDTIDPSIYITKDEYIQRLIPYQVALHALGYQVYVQQRPVIMVFEGWDAAGKGGIIKRVTENLDPRGYVVHAIAAPDGDDKTHHYLWRFWHRLPEKGQIAIFDRSWYGRVMVERIEGFCAEAEWKRAYREINHFERQLVDFGTVLFKFWIHISKDEQLRRFDARKENELKAWKLTDEDWRNREKWDVYSEAVSDMLLKTSTLTAPWTIIEGNCKWYGRIRVLNTLVKELSLELDYDPFTELPSLRKEEKKAKKKVEEDKAIQEAIELPMIQEFEYEKIVIDGETYKTDVAIMLDGHIEAWERKEEHELHPRDIKMILEQQPKSVILGLGTIGNLTVTPQAYKKLKDAGIEVLAYKTEKAVETYKERRAGKDIVALIHIGD
ncbi:MAG: hypothetical protein GTO18_14775 [Anaerolineales bacterium]|nr:hypothetical protein [Anaerolineales bacterium]